MAMKINHSIILLASSMLLFINWKNVDKHWIAEKHKGYILWYTSIDKGNKKEYNEYIATGIKLTASFFNASYKKRFRNRCINERIF